MNSAFHEPFGLAQGSWRSMLVRCADEPTFHEPPQILVVISVVILVATKTTTKTTTKISTKTES